MSFSPTYVPWFHTNQSIQHKFVTCAIRHKFVPSRRQIHTKYPKLTVFGFFVFFGVEVTSRRDKFCETYEFVRKWQIYVEVTVFLCWRHVGVTDFGGWKVVAFVRKWRLNWRVEVRATRRFFKNGPTNLKFCTGSLIGDNHRHTNTKKFYETWSAGLWYLFFDR